MTKEEFKRRFTELTGLDATTNLPYRCKKHHIDYSKSDGYTAKELDRLTYKKGQQYGGIITAKINQLITECRDTVDKNQVYYRMRVAGIIKTDLATMEYSEFKRRIVDEWIAKSSKKRSGVTHASERALSRFSNRGLFNYIWWEDILPLREALKRGIYNSDGTLNVFKDPKQEYKPVTKYPYIEYVRSRGYSVEYSYESRSEYPASYSDGLYQFDCSAPTTADLLGFKRVN